MSADDLKKIANNEVPELALNAIVAGMKMAYIAPVSEEVENTFRFHARQVLIERAKIKAAG